MKATDPRAVALEALQMMAAGQGANAALAAALDGVSLSDRDRAFATALTYGTTRMRRACDWLAAPYIRRHLDDAVREAVRMGVYQLAHVGTPAHAAVSATVEVAPRRARGLVNAVLRRVAGRVGEGPVNWPDEPTRLSYPDWIVDRLTADIGAEPAMAALEAMNLPQEVVVRSDGYRQGRASLWVADQVEAGPGEVVVDLCAAPGGKSTAMATRAGLVVAAELDPARLALLTGIVERHGPADRIAVVRADAEHPPLAAASVDAVLVDAPCSGLGALSRRPDARWRVRPHDVDRLAGLQRRILGAAAELVRPGGSLVYAVCTATRAETTGVDRWLARERPDLRAEPPTSGPWRPWGRGGIVLPQDHGTDGMVVYRFRRDG